MFAAGNQDIETIGRIVELPRSIGRLDYSLIGSRRNDHRDARQMFAHAEKAKGRRQKFKV
jgi:hypothetical protein